MKAIHITQARRMLDSGEKVSLRCVTRDGSIMEAKDVVSLSFDHYSGTRTIKFLASGEKRTIRDVMLIWVNDMEVYL